MDGDLNFLLLLKFGKSRDCVSLEVYWWSSGLCVLPKFAGSAILEEWKGKDGQATQEPGVELGVLSPRLAL